VAGEGRIEVSEHDYEAEAHCWLVFAQTPANPGTWQYVSTALSPAEAESQRLAVQHKWRGRGGAITLLMPQYDADAIAAADQRGYERGLRDAREAVLRARVEQVGNGTLAAIDALIAKATP
jgi:hypothetical protein